MFLESFTKHPSRSTANHIFKSVLCGRCGTVNYHPLLNIYEFNAFGGWRCDRGTTKLHARILWEKGVQKKKPNLFTVGLAFLWEAQQAQLLPYQCMYI
jgi:hypothetical protein